MPDQLAKYTTLELKSATIDTLFTGDLNIAAAVAKREFGTDFDKYPVSCQAALIDIAFNCGSFRTFQTNFVPAIKGTGMYAKKTIKERWQVAANHSGRGKVSAERNLQIKKWISDGANTIKP